MTRGLQTVPQQVVVRGSRDPCHPFCSCLDLGLGLSSADVSILMDLSGFFPPELLQNTFISLGYEVQCFLLLTMKDIIQILHRVAHMPRHQDYDSFVCVLISRGSSHSVFGVDPSSSGLPLDHIRRMFMGDRCPYLVGKPKLFFIQNYVKIEHHPEDCSFLEVDGSAMNNVDSKARQPGPCVVHREADFLWSLCKADVSLLERPSISPSMYMQFLAKKLWQER